MSTFNYYSEYYDLLYKDKDYAGESEYVYELIKKFDAKAKSIIDFGCGTGNHDLLLAEKGFKVTGIDLSQSMIDEAILKSKDKPLLELDFQQGDFRDVRLDEKFDLAVSLFHVMSYQTTNNDLVRAFTTANYHLKRGGIFIFDFWYGPGVLTEPPVVRVKRLENERITVTRISEPVMYPNENKVDVSFEVQIKDKHQQDTKLKTLHEVHPMRYMFLPELILMMQTTGFEFIAINEWMKNSKPKIDTWNAVIICRKKLE